MGGTPLERDATSTRSGKEQYGAGTEEEYKWAGGRSAQVITGTEGVLQHRNRKRAETFSSPRLLTVHRRAGTQRRHRRIHCRDSGRSGRSGRASWVLGRDGESGGTSKTTRPQCSCRRFAAEAAAGWCSWGREESMANISMADSHITYHIHRHSASVHHAWALRCRCRCRCRQSTAAASRLLVAVRASIAAVSVSVSAFASDARAQKQARRQDGLLSPPPSAVCAWPSYIYCEGERSISLRCAFLPAVSRASLPPTWRAGKRRRRRIAGRGPVNACPATPHAPSSPTFHSCCALPLVFPSFSPFRACEEERPLA
ncbi:hypothetical protein P171DRAFT_161817 [Karstenula rhodostoma CBS 690.94]|uniref:Uncharacterized protein n=1 Tax=Karstenula rhodostoma CBS 690.94 TaxID=1392251 RepID=A0A9P4U6T3_9PLEO|nr:hypothetical protein P171DRAFT_161817 [Karstenula rhodostoma CBS 690.94]